MKLYFHGKKKNVFRTIGNFFATWTRLIVMAVLNFEKTINYYIIIIIY